MEASIKNEANPIMTISVGVLIEALTVGILIIAKKGKKSKNVVFFNQTICFKC